MGCDGLPAPTSPQICETGGGGYVLPLFGDAEHLWNSQLRSVLYLFGLLYCFMGVAVISDVFMGAIEKITSKKVLALDPKIGKLRTMTVWNPTVANLTLMALGSSAPEILINVIGIFPNFQASELGPSTIVGSAAFNLLCIVALCVVSIPRGDVRKIKDMGVFSCTAFFSVFAYVWLLVILEWSSPNVVETWEGVLTFLQFWVLVLCAYLLDIGCYPGGAASTRLMVQAEPSQDDLCAMELSVRRKYGQFTNLTPEQVSLLMDYEFFSPHSRAMHRVSATRSLFGGKQVLGTKGNKSPYRQGMELAQFLKQRPGGSGMSIMSSIGEDGDVKVEFQALNYTVLESVGTLKITVRCKGCSTGPVEVTYATRDGTAHQDDDYHRVEGTLEFGPGVLEQTIALQIVNSEGLEETEEFYVDLLEGPIGKRKTVTVVIIDEDSAGVLKFETEQKECQGMEEDQLVKVTVLREHGSTGKIRCNWATEDGDAMAGADYDEASGVLEFEDGQQSAEICVNVKANFKYEGTEYFRVILSDPQGGSAFDASTDGGSDSCILTVIILADEDRRGRMDKLANLVRINWDAVDAGNANYRDQFVSAFFCGGSLAAQKEAGWSEYAAHVAAFPWKVLFATVPPTEYAGGWVCFFTSLLMIGGVTVIIGDLAELLGCTWGISKSTTAITLVALGTSLPDTFASKTAAQMEPHADSSIGNVTGSNSVNVYLGLGLPWTIAAVYWQFVAACVPGDSWWQLYPKEAVSWPEGIFVVPAGALSTSVLCFSLCAGVCIAVLVLRRQVIGGELGGPPVYAWLTFAFLVGLWFLYIAISIAFEAR